MPQTGCASSALTATPCPTFFPRAFRAFSRKSRKFAAGVLRDAAALKVRRRPSAAPDRHRGRDGRGLEINRRRHMAHIGTFQANSEGFEGEVFMVPLTTKGVRIVKETKPNRNPKAPSHRIFVGRSEIGQAWPKTTNDDRDYLSLTFDF